MLSNRRVVEFVPGEFPVLLGYATLAIYGCVPETDQMPTIALMVIGLLAIELITCTTSAPVVQVAAAGIVLWSGLHGATGRGSAIVGAWFAFWPLVLVIGSEVVFGPLRPSVRWTIGSIGGGAAVVVARTGAIEPTMAPALRAVAIAVAVSAGGSWAVVRVSARPGARATRR